VLPHAHPGLFSLQHTNTQQPPSNKLKRRKLKTQKSISFSRFCLLYHRLGTKRMGRPSACDHWTPRAERPPRQPRTLRVTVVGCSMGIWTCSLRVDRGMDGFRGPSGAHFVVCSLLVLGPKYQVLPSRRFVAQKHLDEERLGNGWMIVSHQPPTVVNRWRRGVEARVVLGLTIVVARCGYFGATFEGRRARHTRGIYNLSIPCPPVLTNFSIVMRYLGVGDPSS
jgi:hypothetical protein